MEALYGTIHSNTYGQVLCVGWEGGPFVELIVTTTVTMKYIINWIALFRHWGVYSQYLVYAKVKGHTSFVFMGEWDLFIYSKDADLQDSSMFSSVTCMGGRTKSFNRKLGNCLIYWSRCQH